MKLASYDDVFVFAEVARAKGFRAAAKKLKMSPGSVSETIQRIENRIGVRLFERTTRKISLTAVGKKLLQDTLPALGQLESALGDIDSDANTMAGTLRLSAPRSSSPFFLDDLIARFCILYPDVRVEVIYDDKKLDLVSSRIDAAIRSQTLLEPETHAVEVGPKLDMVLAASPKYLNVMGTPTKPIHLTDHDGIMFSFGHPDQLAPWTFKDDKVAEYTVAPKPRIIVNDLVSMMHFSRSGLGLAYMYRKPAEPYLKQGALVAVLEKYVPCLPKYTINYLTKRHMPQRLRAFIDLAKLG